MVDLSAAPPHPIALACTEIDGRQYRISDGLRSRWINTQLFRVDFVPAWPTDLSCSAEVLRSFRGVGGGVLPHASTQFSTPNLEFTVSSVNSTSPPGLPTELTPGSWLTLEFSVAMAVDWYAQDLRLGVEDSSVLAHDQALQIQTCADLSRCLMIRPINDLLFNMSYALELKKGARVAATGGATQRSIELPVTGLRPFELRFRHNKQVSP